MAPIADARSSMVWPNPPFGVAPETRFLEVYNLQLAREVPAMEEWWVFGGFLNELDDAEDRVSAEALLRCLESGVPGDDDSFLRYCAEIEAYAAPAWARRMQVRDATSLDDLQPNQTGARLAALAAVAQMIGWDVGNDLQASGFGTVLSTWHFHPIGGGERRMISTRVGRPWSTETADPVDIDFILFADEPPSGSVRHAFRRLVELTEAAAKSPDVVDLLLKRRLEALRQH
jgi:hypothetical protein